VRLPEAIERAIDREATAAPGKALARAAEALSARYRERPRGAATPLTDVERLAYAIVRAPATFAAVASVVSELRRRAPDLRVSSLLDLGAGPGAATWAALAQREEIERVTLIEQDRGFIDLGRRLVAELPSAAAAADALEWREADLRRPPTVSALSLSAPAPSLPVHDLVIISYALGELDPPAAQRLIERAWSAASQALIIVEPGTPFHFQGVLAARDWLIREGAFIAAPCPHAATCPMAGAASDWCHMAARVERTSLHRRLKAGELPYEDEKFSYVIAVRAPAREHQPAQRAAARIVRRPEIQKGFVTLSLCTPAGLKREGVTRSQREAFRIARKARWGDAWQSF
jgi:ribosomal protein RSM22 (predicted rRNA methylase)